MLSARSFAIHDENAAARPHEAKSLGAAAAAAHEAQPKRRRALGDITNLSGATPPVVLPLNGKAGLQPGKSGLVQAQAQPPPGSGLAAKPAAAATASRLAGLSLAGPRVGAGAAVRVVVPPVAGLAHNQPGLRPRREAVAVPMIAPAVEEDALPAAPPALVRVPTDTFAELEFCAGLDLFGEEGRPYDEGLNLASYAEAFRATQAHHLAAAHDALAAPHSPMDFVMTDSLSAAPVSSSAAAFSSSSSPAAAAAPGDLDFQDLANLELLDIDV